MSLLCRAGAIFSQKIRFHSKKVLDKSVLMNYFKEKFDCFNYVLASSDFVRSGRP